MTDPYLSEIRAVSIGYAPQRWALCEGQLLPSTQHTTLVSLIGRIYGGDVSNTVALPDLRGRTPIGEGHGPGLRNRYLGAMGGVEKVTLTDSNISNHSHTISVQTGGQPPNASDPNGNLLSDGQSRNSYSSIGSSPESLGVVSGETGVGQAHNNMQPYLTINFIIALDGTFPSRPNA